MKRLRKFFDTYQLELGEDTITCQQPGMKTTTITRDSISNIQEIPGKELRIWADHNRLLIAIPQTLEDYEAVAEIVSSWWAPGEDAQPQRVTQLPVWVVIPIMGIVIFATSLGPPIIAIPVAVIMMAVFGWLLFHTVRSRQLGMANKTFIIFLLSIMLLGFLMRLVLALMRLWVG